MPTRKASAVWNGTLRGGNGSFEGSTGAVSGPYTFSSRFEEGSGSNPEELLAAAEAACFSMALSGNLEKKGGTPEKVETQAACTVEKVGDGFSITRMKLDVQVRVAGIDEATFQEALQAARDGCPVSRALKGNVQIEVTGRMV
ncbi:MAG TPA: OsmC family peroxiredoxin [Gemmatimonadaceae bacterium]|nr:OsmC family peroxiredoxin [Gemmatimonadaceae bacterium]